MPSTTSAALRDFADAARRLADALDGVDSGSTTAAQDAADIADADKAMKNLARTGTVPGKVVHAILGGASPVRAWRDHLGLSQKELAERAGVGQGYLSQIESGKRAGGADALEKIARALGVTPAQLLTDEGHGEESPAQSAA